MYYSYNYKVTLNEMKKKKITTKGVRLRIN